MTFFCRLSRYDNSVGRALVVVRASRKAAKGDGVAFIVHGVNQADGEHIVSCASSTTNCIVPVIEMFGRRIGLTH